MDIFNLKRIITELLLELEDQPETSGEEVPSEEGSVKRKISKNEAAQLIKNTKGKFFTISFTKKDGTNRVINARLGVKIYLKGGTLPYNPDEKGLIPVFDAKAKGYRMVNLNTVNKLIIDKTEYEVI